MPEKIAPPSWGSARVLIVDDDALARTALANALGTRHDVEFFDVAVSPGDNKTLTHSLSTVVISPDGKIFRWYPNNEWPPAAVVDDIRHAAAQ